MHSWSRTSCPWVWRLLLCEKKKKTCLVTARFLSRLLPWILSYMLGFTSCRCVFNISCSKEGSALLRIRSGLVVDGTLGSFCSRPESGNFRPSPIIYRFLPKTRSAMKKLAGMSDRKTVTDPNAAFIKSSRPNPTSRFQARKQKD
ncbi:hypothetical protein BDV28DRAFT_486 [Aspergillus coremiiformis]|uniref:Uncharacterized protein n=1 Tax=Aspergillus coremiiformis TaxID=138285 RepID=A0A5N6ZH35_9EURO|nr:hypothetical protein BDV28DRAFT_486 [Aspergillus coremiiformis]